MFNVYQIGWNQIEELHRIMDEAEEAERNILDQPDTEQRQIDFD